MKIYEIFSYINILPSAEVAFELETVVITARRLTANIEIVSLPPVYEIHTMIQ